LILKEKNKLIGRIPIVDDNSSIVPRTSNTNESFGKGFKLEPNRADVSRSPVRV
jgi:hypothetical protein